MMANRPAPGTRADYRAFRDIAPRWEDVDAFGHLRSAACQGMIESAVTFWLIEAGLMAPGPAAPGGAPEAPIAQIGRVIETGCRFHGALGYAGPLVAGLRVTRLGLSSVRFEVGLFDTAAEAAAVEGYLLQGCVDPDSGRPIPLSAPLRAGLAALKPAMP